MRSWAARTVTGLAAEDVANAGGGMTSGASAPETLSRALSSTNERRESRDIGSSGGVGTPPDYATGPLRRAQKCRCVTWPENGSSAGPAVRQSPHDDWLFRSWGHLRDA